MARRTESVLTALYASLRQMDPDRLDGATVALAKRYAAELDGAAVVSKQLAKPLRELLKIDPDLHDRFLILATKVEATAVAAAIGPKLLAALEQLQMTPRARAAVVKGGAGGDGDSGGGDAGRVESELERVRRERQAARANTS